MTTSRVVRGTKVRIFLYVCAVITIIGLVACYNNTLSQLEDIKRANDLCRKQEENLSTQIQGISEYKQQLEKSLKTEQSEHKKTKVDLESKIKEHKRKYDKETEEAKTKFDTLKQHYNLLQTQHDDYKEESRKTEKEHLDQISELKDQIKKCKEDFENLKSEYLTIQISKENLEKQVRGNEDEKQGNESKINALEVENHELRRTLDTLKDSCPESLHPPQADLGQNLTNQNSQASGNVADQPPREEKQQNQQNVLALPQETVSKSTPKSISGVSKASLDGARPLLVPTITPGSLKKSGNEPVFPLPYKQVPQGVVPMPPQLGEEKSGGDLVDNRYQNKINEVKKQEEAADRENGAHEELDGQMAAYDGLGFADGVKADKIEVKHNAKHKRRNQNPDEQPAEETYLEEADDDDQDAYGGIGLRGKEPAIRHK